MGLAIISRSSVPEVPELSCQVVNPSNKHQRYYLGVEMKGNTGLPQDKLLQLYSIMVKREIRDLGELTFSEASKLCKHYRERYR